MVGAEADLRCGAARYKRGAWPETAGSSRATRTTRWTWSLPCTSDAPTHVGGSTTTPVNPAGLGSSACCDQHLVTHSAPCRLSASIKRGANMSSAVSEVVVSSHFPASGKAASGSARCCHSNCEPCPENAVVRSPVPVREQRARCCPTCHTTRPPRGAALCRPGLRQRASDGLTIGRRVNSSYCAGMSDSGVRTP